MAKTLLGPAHKPPSKPSTPTGTKRTPKAFNQPAAPAKRQVPENPNYNRKAPLMPKAKGKPPV